MSDNQITVINPQGVLGSIPSTEWLSAQAQGFSLPSSELHSSDLSPDKKNANVYSPDGTLGSIPIEQLDVAQSQGYKLASQYNPQIKKEAQNLADIKSGSFTDIPAKYKALQAQHQSDDIQDEQGNYKLKTPNGETVLVPPEQLDQYLADHNFKFKDDKFQALVDARVESGKATQGLQKGDITQGLQAASNTATLLPAGDMVNAYRLGAPGVLTSLLGKSSSDPLQKADIIASKLLQSQYQTARTAGTIAGIGANIITPGFGKVEGAASLAGKLIPSLVEEGAGLAKQVAAKALSGAIEGAVISAPQVMAQGLIQKDIKGAAESLGLGIGLGGTLGALGKLSSVGLEALNTAKINRASSALQTIGGTEEILQKLQIGAKEEPFLKTLIDQGITKNSSPAQIEEALRKLSAGDHLEKLLPGLDKVSGDVDLTNLRNRITDQSMINNRGFLYKDSQLAELADKFTNRLNEMSPDNKLSLGALKRFTSEIGEDINWKLTSDAAEDITKSSAQNLNDVKKQIFQTATSELLNAGNKAAENADAKLASAWAKDSQITQTAQEMHGQLLQDIAAGKLEAKASPIVEMISKLGTKGIVHTPTAALGGLGYAVGGPVGGAIGGLIGHGISNKISNSVTDLVEKYVTNPSNSTKLGGWLTKNAASQAIGSYLTLDAMHAIGERIQQIPDFINDLTIKSVPTIFQASSNPIKDILGPEANGLSKQQQFDRLSDKVATLAGNQAVLSQHIQAITSPIAESHPELAQQFSQDLTNKIQYLNQMLHGNNSAVTIVPFQKQKDYTPTMQELQEIEDQLRIAQNPFALLDGLKNGNVTSKQVATASALNPTILSQIRDEINKEAYLGKTDLTYQQRLAASIIMDQPMDQSLKSIPQLQAIYVSQNSGQPASNGKSGHKLNAAKMPSAQGTLGQRLMGK